MAPFILRFFALLMLGLPGVCALMAQEKGGLPMAVEIQETYEKGYRNLDGTPGEKYWTNTADYTFDVNLDLEADVLEGKGKITYTNNSPRRLSQVVIRLGQDLYKKGGIRDFQARLSQLHDGVRINRVAVRGEEVDLSGAPAQRAARRPRFRQSGTNIFLRLGKSLPSGESVDIEIDWAYDLPDGGVQRQGKYAENAYFIAYWYPEIAVYDELDGWDSRNYSGTVEMYHDFSNYEVNLTVPDQVFVWATGLLQNPDEILTNEYLQRFQQAGRTDEVVRIVTTEDLNKGGILKKNGRNTWRFKAREVPDFAFAVADSFLWDGTSVEVAPGRRVLVDVGYRQGARWYDEAAEIARLSVKDMSEKLPGVPYPYPQVSVFNGAGGMEFPMIVNDGRVRGRQDLIDLTYHEIVHTYFPFYMGINERKYAWMDEGWAQLLPNDLIRELEPEGGDPMIGNSFSVASYAGREEDLPLMTPTYMLRGQAYGIHSYTKPACAYYILREELGDELFAKCLQTYIERWHNKHPLPHDFFFTFNEVSGRNLNWFWRAWFFEATVPDLGLKEVVIKGKKALITVEKVGATPIPIHLTITFEDGEEMTIKRSVSVWEDGKKELQFKEKFAKPIKKMTLGSSAYPDKYRDNNSWRPSGS